MVESVFKAKEVRDSLARFILPPGEASRVYLAGGRLIRENVLVFNERRPEQPLTAEVPLYISKESDECCARL